MSSSDGKDGPKPWVEPQSDRRLSDRILTAFHHAREQKDFEVAEQLLRIFEVMLTRRPDPPVPNRRRQQNRESLVAALEWLWSERQRHPGYQAGGSRDATAS
jgi:hypothetical protein